MSDRLGGFCVLPRTDRDTQSFPHPGLDSTRLERGEAESDENNLCFENINVNNSNANPDIFYK